MIKEYYTPKEIQKMLSLNKSTLYYKINNGEIPSIRIGKKLIRIPKDLFEKFLEDAKRVI